jgi:LuxR family transcriptional regulator, maltose regulon positive regulatory protein
LYEWGDLEVAQREVENWLTLSKQGGHVAAVTYGGVVLSRVRQAQGDSADAEVTLDQAVEQLRYGMPAWVSAQVVAQQVALALARGDAAAASQALAGSGVTTGDPTGYSSEVIHLAYLRLLLHLGRMASGASRLDRAMDLAGRLLASAEPAGRMGREIETLALRALVCAAQGHAEAALADLSRALALAEPEGYVRLFVNEGAPMAALLRAARERDLRAVYVARLLAAFPDEGGTAWPDQEGLLESFGEREREVLRLLAEGLTYGEIAGRLVVSLNTVRFHVKNIYGKLGVDRRVAAVDRAKVLGLL